MKMYQQYVIVRLQVSQPTPIQQIREARLQPLKIALQDAIALHTKATGVREALEAEVRHTGQHDKRVCSVSVAGLQCNNRLAVNKRVRELLTCLVATSLSLGLVCTTQPPVCRNVQACPEPGSGGVITASSDDSTQGSVLLCVVVAACAAALCFVGVCVV